ncbi:MAG: peroxiredoxin family protein [Dehalococcoidia bacterium]
MEAPHLEALHQMYQDKGIQAIVINVKESKTKSHRWGKSLKFTIPVLLDLDGEVATRYAPEGAAPVLPRDQVPIGSNIIIDREGKIRFYTLLDTMNFDAELIALTECLNQLLEEE